MQCLVKTRQVATLAHGRLWEPMAHAQKRVAKSMALPHAPLRLVRCHASATATDTERQPARFCRLACAWGAAHGHFGPCLEQPDPSAHGHPVAGQPCGRPHAAPGCPSGLQRQLPQGHGGSGRPTPTLPHPQPPLLPSGSPPGSGGLASRGLAPTGGPRHGNWGGYRLARARHGAARRAPTPPKVADLRIQRPARPRAPAVGRLEGQCI